MAEALIQAQRLAAHLDLKLVKMRDGRNGRYRVFRGRDILHATDCLQEVTGFLSAWSQHVR